MKVEIGRSAKGTKWYLIVEKLDKTYLVMKVCEINTDALIEYTITVRDKTELLDIVAEETLNAVTLLNIANTIGYPITPQKAAEWIKDKMLKLIADISEEDVDEIVNCQIYELVKDLC